LVVLPLLIGKELLGVLFLKSLEQRRFSPSVLHFCKVAAGVSANALKNAMLYRDAREMGAKLQRVLDSTPDLIVATDAEGRLTQFNGGAERLLGISARRALGQSLTRILGRDDLRSALGETAPLELSLDRPGRERVEISLVGAPIGDEEGETTGHVWIGRDVTKLRRIE